MPSRTVGRVYALPLATALLAVVAAGCTDRDPPTGPQDIDATAAATAPRDRYVVLMRETSDSRLSANAVGVQVARLRGKIERSHPEIGAMQVRDLSAAAAAELARQPGVEAVVKDRRIQWLPPRTERIRVMNQLIRESGQRGAQFFDQYQWNIKKIKAQQAWNVTPQGEGVAVCILDTGVDPRHIDNVGKLNLDLSASFVANERADRDFDSHGTAMGSVVTTNGLGLASVAPDAGLCSVKVLDRNGSGTFGDVAAGIMFVGDAGRIDGGARVDVANMSLGALLPANDPDIQALARLTQRAIDYSTRRGVLFVASAGNQATNLNNPNIIHLPSGLNNVLSVGATGPIGQRNFDNIASYSNVGRQEVDVFAPGGEFVFAKNVLEDLILLACSPSIRFPGFEVCADRNVYLFTAGTSPAAAHVSGEAAVIESELPGDQTPAELTACILRSADPLPNPQLTANGRINVLRGQACGGA
ncbi:MAG: S8 family serine peptidase [Gemmatimonadales bacterium]|nr:S8 family serine peptidase [Gemmatimonadales bacterium]